MKEENGKTFAFQCFFLYKIYNIFSQTWRNILIPSRSSTANKSMPELFPSSSKMSSTMFNNVLSARLERVGLLLMLIWWDWTNPKLNIAQLALSGCCCTFCIQWIRKSQLDLLEWTAEAEVNGLAMMSNCNCSTAHFSLVDNDWLLILILMLFFFLLSCDSNLLSFFSSSSAQFSVHFTAVVAWKCEFCSARVLLVCRDKPEKNCAVFNWDRQKKRERRKRIENARAGVQLSGFFLMRIELFFSSLINLFFISILLRLHHHPDYTSRSSDRCIKIAPSSGKWIKFSNWNFKSTLSRSIFFSPSFIQHPT